MRSLLLALVLLLTAPMAVSAQEVQSDPPASFLNGFAELAARIPDQVGTPNTAEFANPANDDTIQLTTTGLMFWSPQHLPTWTNGWLHVALSPGGLVRWEGESLDPPAPPLAPSLATGTVSGSSTGWPISGALGARIYCVEAIESSHGRAMFNPVGLQYGNHVEHAQGWLGWMPSTAAAWAAQIGNRASEWAAAARMIAAGRGSAFFGIATGRC